MVNGPLMRSAFQSRDAWREPRREGLQPPCAKVSVWAAIWPAGCVRIANESQSTQEVDWREIFNWFENRVGAVGRKRWIAG
jgi:hypothetical protein